LGAVGLFWDAGQKGCALPRLYQLSRLYSLAAAKLLAALLMLCVGLSEGAFAQPADWTLEKTATPTTYTAAGQIIDYVYVISNNTSFDGTVLSFTDDRAGTPSCPSTTVLANDTLTCSAQYTILPADVTAGSVTNTATVTGCLDTDGCITPVSATDTATVTFDARPLWTLVKTPDPNTYSGPDEEISYSYELTNTGNVNISAISISDNRIAVVDCPFTTLGQRRQHRDRHRDAIGRYAPRCDRDGDNYFRRRTGLDVGQNAKSLDV
jgi:hypothetical protein